MSNQVAFVCNRCLRDYPNRSDLLSRNCLCEGAHANELKVNAQWNSERRRLILVIRPVPRVHFRGPFAICDGRPSCKRIGPRCTYPHCREELEVWNRVKMGTQFHPTHLPIPPPWMSPPPPPGPLVPLASLSSSLGSSSIPQRSFADVVCAGRTSRPRSRFLSEPTTSALAAIPPSLPIQGMRHPSLESESPWPDPVTELGHQPAMSPIAVPPSSSLHDVPLPMPWSPEGEHPAPMFQATHRFGDAPPAMYQPSPQATTARQKAIPRASSRPTHHMDEDHAASKVRFYDRLKHTLYVEVIQQETTRENYKEKFSNLLCWEEMEHINIMDKKCNGSYTLVLHQAGMTKPDWMKFEAKPYHKRFGYITGLTGDQIAYAAQASEGAVIVHGATEIRADILRENFHHTEDRLYLAFDDRSVTKLANYFSVRHGPFKKEGVHIQFELKHFYFNGLHRSIESLPDSIVTRIIPEAADFPAQEVELQPLPKKRRETLDLSSCSQDQRLALQTIVSCPSSGPPILIAGPFGTGKTRILATAVHFMFQQKKLVHGHPPVRVLVCTQQQVSADTFLQSYFDILPPRDRNLTIVRVGTKFGYPNPALKRYYKTVQDFKRTFERSSHSNESDFLVVTTCNTSLSLTEFLPSGFFTHIFLDEGAQMREPEGIAPLSMAGRNTKIVIAGDQHQVGPAMLVLGKKAQENGLAVSLLERLQNLYKQLGKCAQQYCVTLVTNYRCHSGVLNLAAELFYETPLRPWDQEKADASAHPDAPFPLQFVCSSIDDTVRFVRDSTNEDEARIVLKQVREYAAKWPVEGWGQTDLSQLCFISPTRRQVIAAGGLMRYMPSRMSRVRRVPTYDIQGREYRAVFISTSEPTERSGETCNPTKSISDRYVFNTAITRARSLVVAAGNPFMLLRMEDHMVRRYKEKGRCWSVYLRHCLENDTLSIDPSLGVPKARQMECFSKLRDLVKWPLVAPYRAPVEHWPAPTVHIDDSAQGSHTGLLTSGTSVHPSPTREPNPVDTHQEEDIEEESLGSEAYFNSKLEQEFKLLEQLGKGGFGVVYHVRNRNDNEDYALKIVKLPDDVREQKKVKREVKAFIRFKGHPRVVHYYQSWTAKAPRNEILLTSLKSSDSLALTSFSAHSVAGIGPEDPLSANSPSSAKSPSHSTETSVGEPQAESSSTDVVEFRDSATPSNPTNVGQEQRQVIQHEASVTSARPTCLFIQIELCEKDTLKEWLRKNDSRERKIVLDYFVQILEAVNFIHGRDLIHRDLKPSNIFFSRDDNSVKVGDFGLVTGNLTADLSGERQPKSRSSHAGTRLYMAPEQLDRKDYDEKVDIFALGVILFEMNYLCMTDSERVKVLTDIRSKKFPPHFEAMLPQEAQMIEWLLSPEPVARPSAKEITSSPKMQQMRKAVKKVRRGCVPRL